MNRNETSEMSPMVLRQLGLMKFKELQISRNNFNSQKKTGTNKQVIYLQPLPER